MVKRYVVAALLVACVAGSSGASIIPIDEFTGDVFEGFEDLGSPGGVSTPLAIFDGEGTFDDTVAHYGMIAFSLYSALTGDEIVPYDGALMMGSVTGWAKFEFVTPVTEFGGYIGTADELEGSTVTFYDVDGEPLETIDVSIEHPLWKWYGWSSDTPIGGVEIIGHVSPGKPLVFDNMRANVVPEPAALLVLLAVVGPAVVRRR